MSGISIGVRIWLLCLNDFESVNIVRGVYHILHREYSGDVLHRGSPDTYVCVYHILHREYSGDVLHRGSPDTYVCGAITTGFITTIDELITLTAIIGNKLICPIKIIDKSLHYKIMILALPILIFKF